MRRAVGYSRNYAASCKFVRAEVADKGSINNLQRLLQAVCKHDREREPEERHDFCRPAEAASERKSRRRDHSAKMQ